MNKLNLILGRAKLEIFRYYSNKTMKRIRIQTLIVWLPVEEWQADECDDWPGW